jgi:general secretion pathway protein A
VTARCHLGPLDEEDTRSYIEHRLKCAGATDKPTFDAGVFEAIFQHSGGIPRRINALCDRLLLQGFLAESTHFNAANLTEVLDEMHAEAEFVSPLLSVDSANQAADGRPTRTSSLDESEDLAAEEQDLELALTADISEHLTRMSAEQLSARLLRIERSVLRQERVTVELLGVLKKFMANGRKARNEGSKR